MQDGMVGCARMLKEVVESNFHGGGSRISIREKREKKRGA